MEEEEEEEVLVFKNLDKLSKCGLLDCFDSMGGVNDKLPIYVNLMGDM